MDSIFIAFEYGLNVRNWSRQTLKDKLQICHDCVYCVLAIKRERERERERERKKPDTSINMAWNKIVLRPLLLWLTETISWL